MKKYTYTREYHFKKLLGDASKKIQIKEPQKIENKYYELDECPICLEENIKNGIKLTCNHMFCQSCIDTMIQGKDNKCPLCRRETIKEVLKSIGITADLCDSNIDLIMKAFSQVNLVNREQNLPPMNYILYKLAQLFKINIGQDRVPIKTLTRLMYYESWWKSICDHLGWSYIPSHFN